MDAIELLESQHREAETLFTKIREAEPGERAALAVELGQKLTGHMELEEQVFYPAAMAVDDLKVEHAAEEHEDAKPVLDLLLRLRGNEPSYLAIVDDLEQKIRAHVAEEEGRLFPECRQAMSAAQLDELGEEMVELLEAIEDQSVPLGSDDSFSLSP